MNNPIIFCVCGVKNSGKTTLILKLIEILKKDYPKIAVIKHDGHDFKMDYENTDTDLYLKAGALQTTIFSDNKYAMISKKQNIEIGYLIKNNSDMDIIIIEGLKESGFPKIEIVRNGISDKPVCNKKNLIAVVSDINLGKDTIPINNLEKISDVILNYFDIKK